MSWKSRWVAACDECGHEWIPQDTERFGDPKQCAKCKSRRWNDGNEQRGAEGGERQNYGKIGADDTRGEGDISKAHDEAAVPAKRRKAGVRDLRGGIRGDTGDEGPSGSDGATTVRGSHSGAQSDPGAVDRSVQPDTVGEGSGQREELSAEDYRKMSAGDRAKAVEQGRVPWLKRVR